MSSRLPEISIHALLAESDRPQPPKARVLKNFYPRSPCGERPKVIPKTSLVVIDFYPRSPCGERPWAVFLSCNYPLISIHALLAESDGPQGCYTLWEVLFLSTLSLRRATPVRDIIQWEGMNFYPRSPCGERRVLMGGSNCDGNFYPRSPCGERHTVNSIGGDNHYISIHALLAESDYTMTTTICTASKFLSTLSLRRATPPSPPKARDLKNFYPRSPCGERRSFGGACHPVHHFYPRSPCGERRARLRRPPSSKTISIHALLAESDRKELYAQRILFDFYPRSPCGERRQTHSCSRLSQPFLSTLSLRRATL